MVGGPGSTTQAEILVAGCCRLYQSSWQGQLLSSSRTLAVALSKERSQRQRQKRQNSSMLHPMRRCVSQR
eukprot:COSAG02_NODE_3279_length_7026_cov_21.473798_5_plen_70_part_00